MKLGQLLLEKNLITKDQLNEVLEIQQYSGGLLGLILLNKQYITQETLIGILEYQERLLKQ